jgi:two-component system, cell cycle sensor histidine kinase and response regulator CckA
MGDGIITTDRNGVIQHMNCIAEQLTGWKETEVQGKLLDEVFTVVHEETRHSIENPVKKVIRERSKIDFSNHTLLIAKDGRETPIADSAAPICNGSEEMVGVVLTFRDQTVERRARNSLRKSQALLEKTQARAKLGGWEFDTMTGKGYWSKEMYRLHSIEPREVPPNFQEFLELVHPDDRQTVTDHHRAALRDGKNYEIEYRTNPTIGPQRVISTDVECITNEKSVVIQVIGTNIDITDRKKYEEDLKKREQLFRTTLYSIGDGVVTTNASGRIEQMNPVAEKLTGWTETEAYGVLLEEVFRIINEESRATVENPVEKVLREGIVVGLANHTLLIAKDGTETPIADSAAPIRSETGEVAGVVLVFRDQSAEREAEKKLAAERSLLRTVIDNIPDAVYAKDRSGCKILANPADLRNLGKTAEEVLGKTDFEVFPMKIAEKFDADDKLVMNRKEGIMDREELLMNEEGEVRWLLTSKLPWVNNEGEVIGLVGIGHDITNRKKAVEDLRKREEMLRTTLYSIGEGVITTDTKGFVDHINPVAESLTGWSEAEARGKKLDELFSIVNEESRTPVENPVEKVFKSGAVVGLANHTLLIAKDGRETPIADSAAPIRDESGEIIGVVLVFRDQSAERDAEKKLSHERSLLRTVIDNIPDAVYAKDRIGRKILANPADLQNVGKSAKEVIGKTDYEVFPQEIARQFDADDKTIMKNGEGIIGREELLVNRRGEQRWLLTSKLPWRDESGAVVGIVGIGHDITERKRSEEALRESEERYRQFFEGDLTADFITTVDGNILMFNPAFLKIFGFNTADEVLHTRETDLWPTPERREEFLDLLRTQRKLTYYPLELRRSDGSPLHAVANIIGVFDMNDELRKLQVYLFDETQKKLLEEQFRQAQKLESLGTLAGGIAHDFNNILSIIMGHSAMIEPGRSDADRIAHSLYAINTATERGAALVNQLLTFARKTEVVAQSVLVNEIVEEVTRLLGETFPKTIVLQKNLKEDLPPIVADGTQIHQVFLNLCVNARDAMKHGGTLTISTSTVSGEDVSPKLTGTPASSYVLIQVSDTGEGIEDSIQERIFDPFFTTKGSGEGTGLGLSLVYSIIENHDGFITVDSEVGSGSTFHIYLPIESEKTLERPAAEVSTGPARGGDETVLLIEDEEFLREYAETILTENGYTVMVAGDGEEGVRLYSQHAKDIDVVISDLGLPKLAGEEVFKRIRTINQKAKVVLASGFVDPSVKSKTYKAGARYFLRKPFSPDDLLRIVRDTLENR